MMSTAPSRTQAPDPGRPNLKLRFDRLLRSKHKYLCSTSAMVELKHDGRTIRLLVPEDHPPCDFLVAAAADDWLFLIGRQRPTSEESWCYAGAIVVARRRGEDLYATEFWHETYGSFLMRTGLELSPTNSALRLLDMAEVPAALAVLPPPVADFLAGDFERSGA